MLRLVAVEDRDDHMEWLTKLLDKLGPELPCEVVRTFQDWNAARNFIESNASDFDVVVTDLQDRETRRFEGLELIRCAKSQGKGAIAVSSFLDDLAHMQNIIRKGADFYVKKPFKPEWRTWSEYPDELDRSAYISMYFALRRFREAPVLQGLPQNHIFLSHTTDDQAKADELNEAFEREGFETFMAAQDLTGGMSFRPEIRDAIVAAQLVVPLITSRSKDRAWVMYEIGAAWGLAKPIIPAIAYVDYDDVPAVIGDLQAERVETAEQTQALVRSARRQLDT